MLSDPANESCTVCMTCKVFPSDKDLVSQMAKRLNWSEGMVVRALIRIGQVLIDSGPLKEFLSHASKQDSFNLARQ